MTSPHTGYRGWPRASSASAEMRRAESYREGLTTVSMESTYGRVTLTFSVPDDDGELMMRVTDDDNRDLAEFFIDYDVLKKTVRAALRKDKKLKESPPQ